MNKEDIEKILGFEAPVPAGPFMYIMTYIRDDKVYTKENGELVYNEDGTPKVLYLPESVRKNDEYTAICGRVISQGPDCYVGDRFKSGPRCNVGDWVLFSVSDSRLTFKYRGVPMRIIYDDAVTSVIDDPSFVTRD